MGCGEGGGMNGSGWGITSGVRGVALVGAADEMFSWGELTGMFGWEMFGCEVLGCELLFRDVLDEIHVTSLSLRDWPGRRL